MKRINDVDLYTVCRALDDAAYYRLGTEAGSSAEIEDDDDRELFESYRELLDRLESA